MMLFKKQLMVPFKMHFSFLKGVLRYLHLCTRMYWSKIASCIFDTSAIHGGRMPVLLDAYTDVGGRATQGAVAEQKPVTTKLPGAILSVNPEGVSLMEEVNKKLLFLKIPFVVLMFCLFSLTTAQAKELISEHCEPLVESQSSTKDIRHSKGLLWEISKGDKETSYLFGTIHVSDTEITSLPDVVDKALHESDQFVMEALPDLEQMLLLSQMMFFSDGQRLSEFVDANIYNKTTEVLSSYQLGPDAVSVMKPWAAFLLMNYPPDQGEPLDLVLLSLARQNGATVAGLESLKEQGEIFNQLSLDEQVKLLTDTVCHYDVVEEDFTIMKSLYLKRDLGGMYRHAQRYTMIDKPVYKKLMQRLIVDRNNVMVERMQPMLEKGSSFIAIGAMHLIGEEGVLALLEKRGYSVSSIF